ncbi:hypothetical protein M9435_002105 [Picochlorum sp. BPE23]|nr:hypothetical protein M9435_002105 [Picochlorum sp. BPE23]
MDEDLYDEFGNYIGPELSESGGEEEEEAAVVHGHDHDQLGGLVEGGQLAVEQEDDAMMVAEEEENAIVLHEDKKYYPTAEETYGVETETLVQEEDAQPLEIPIIAPIVKKQIEVDVKDEYKVKPLVSREFMVGLSDAPELVRNVAVMGHLHHGKTTMMDMFVEQTHEIPGAGFFGPDNPMRFTDTRRDEQQRGVSLKAVPMTFVMEDSRGKSFAMNMMDCPGHPNFSDETCAASRLSDGVVLVVDAAEGVMLSTKQAIQIAAAEGLSLVLVLSKVDRLIVELKLPPVDAYYKIRHTIQEVNALIATSYGPGAGVVLSPAKGNVAFMSAMYGWSFTLESFAQLYCDIHASPMNPKALAQRLWGDVWYDPETRMFRKKPAEGSGERSFVQWIMEPMYKIYSQILGEDSSSVRDMVREMGVELPHEAFDADVKPLLKTVLSSVFGSASGIVDMVVKHIPSAASGTSRLVDRCYTGPHDSETVRRMKLCDATGPLCVYVCKMFPKSDCSAFDAFARVVSGTIKNGQKARVLGESYSPDDEEDSVVATVSNLWKYQARYRVPIEQASAGSWILLEGLDDTIFKTATIVEEFTEEEIYIMKPLRLESKAVVKIATEPLNPGELPKMVDGLRKVNRSYPALTTKVEESGEHTIFGTGELYLDTAMKDLRELFSDVEVKVADPVVSFCETVVETSSLKCFSETPNKKNKLTVIAEPLDQGLAEDLEKGAVSIDWSKKKIAGFFQDSYDWDVMAARSVWAFGPDAVGPNIFLDDTLPSEVDKSLVNAIKSSVVQGFQWGAREGPLCDEPMRSVKFKLTDAVVASELLARGGGQIIPTARRVCYSAFLMASPRLMEPVYYVEIQTPADCISAIYAVLAKRRGHVTADVPKPGTPIFIVQAFLPVMDSFGFETDIRVHTQGQAFCCSTFDHWQVVPGDPLDKNIVLRPLEPAPMQSLARDFMVKTRRRKGMTDDVSVTKYFDDPMLLDMIQSEDDI